jgi:hypothetical protein
MTASMAVSSKTTQNSLYESKNYKPFPANNLNSEMGSTSNNPSSKKKTVGGSEREREQEEDHNTNEEDDDDDDADDHVFHLDLSNNINLYNR